ncbi:hypothetical protein [Actinomadura sp. DC4]|uniref:hypothetical protein n=1 Tax=Actinomadura sp. DC4 TaxID=3055069 RepID=UPI0025B0E77A|nr:hypothetical protein [Actinomadura sp. DC4]MDN3357896.1 hypothetical protein [Actinomadura sp. DC4]
MIDGIRLEYDWQGDRYLVRQTEETRIPGAEAVRVEVVRISTHGVDLLGDHADPNAAEEWYFDHLATRILSAQGRLATLRIAAVEAAVVPDAHRVHLAARGAGFGALASAFPGRDAAMAAWAELAHDLALDAGRGHPAPNGGGAPATHAATRGPGPY